MEQTLKSFSLYRDEIAAKLFSSRVSEAVAAPAETAADPDEYLTQCIWFDSLFVHENLRTDAGESLEIIHPGSWNRGEGPDFRGAKLRINGKNVGGDIEIHISASGWRQHRHHLNPSYDSVVLHAYLRLAEKPVQARNSRGEPISGFAMEPVLFPDLDTIRQTIHLEDYPYRIPSAVGRCQPLMCTLEENYLRDLLEAAGRQRIEGKVRRYRDQAVGESLDQVFYQAVMTAMGLKSSKSLFFLLSKRAPVSEMMDYAREVDPAQTTLFFQAVLLNVANLAPQGAMLHAMDAESAAYADPIIRTWERFSGYYSDRLIPPTNRWNTGVRPPNFAYRRLAGIAHLLVKWFKDGNAVERFVRAIDGFDPALPLGARRRWIRERLVSAFVVDDSDDFWAWRYTFASKRAPRPMRLIGENRAESVVFNALLPILLVHARQEGDARLEERIWPICLAFPPLESNSIVRHMRLRLFGGHERGKTALDSEAKQQALFQIFADCCNMNEQSCHDCYYFQSSHQRSSAANTDSFATPHIGKN
jgi:hypothetical protein